MRRLRWVLWLVVGLAALALGLYLWRRRAAPAATGAAAGAAKPAAAAKHTVVGKIVAGAAQLAPQFGGQQVAGGLKFLDLFTK